MSKKLAHFTTKRRKSAKNLGELDTDGRLLFEFLTLVVNIRHRSEDDAIARENSEAYTKEDIRTKVLADQKSSVDDGLQGYRSTEGF